jgi:hypothetical protein
MENAEGDSLIYSSGIRGIFFSFFQGDFRLFSGTLVNKNMCFQIPDSPWCTTGPCTGRRPVHPATAQAARGTVHRNGIAFYHN